MSAQSNQTNEIIRTISEISFRLYTDWAAQADPNSPTEEFEKLARKSLWAAAAYVDSGVELNKMVENMKKFGNLLGKLPVEKGL